MLLYKHYIELFSYTFCCVFTITSAQSSCEKRLTCQDCIVDPGLCVWCVSVQGRRFSSLPPAKYKAINYMSYSWSESNTKPLRKNLVRSTLNLPLYWKTGKNVSDGVRCKPRDLISNLCNQIENPNTTQSVTRNHEFSSTPGNVTQMRPQNMKINLRVGDTTYFNFSFLAAKDYPVDLYFLIDASLSMINMKKTIGKQGTKIYDTMMDLTNNVYMGLGTFIDKNAVPYVIDENVTTYSFKNEFKLTNNPEEFKNRVNEIKLGSNLDPQEGGLDALTQVILCKKEIGWRLESRKIVVFMTDAPYHTAGDGKWAGIFTPHDARCHMKDGEYTKALEYDYPSVSLINKLVADEEIVIIFAVNDSSERYYMALSDIITGSKYTVIKENSDDVVNLLKMMYQEITKSILLKTNVLNGEVNKNVEIKINPDCRRKSIDTECNLQNKEEINFEASIKLQDYKGIDNFKIGIVPEGIMERLTLDVNIIKDCVCQKNSEPKSPMCHNGGSYECGICKCNSNRYGEMCRCTSTYGGTNDKTTCTANGTNLECSGNGHCSCGSCVCNEGYEGRYCDCNKESCPRNLRDSSLCSANGKCECGTCWCDPQWTGVACECPISNVTCIDPHTLKICSGRGDCVCGACKCHPIPAWDTRNEAGEHCSIAECTSPACQGRQCRALIDCALCFYNNGNTTSACDSMCHNNIVPATVKKMAAYNLTGPWIECPELGTNIGCYTRFFYKYNNEFIDILIQTESDCIKSYYMYGGISLGLVLLVGLATLVAWKLLTDARDRREYERFKKQYASALWPETDNPIYQPASTTFRNPVFGKRSASEF